eukprot:352129-Chlamydomonas_euryale.AAC.8
MPVLNAARQRGSNSSLGAVTKGASLHHMDAVMSHPIPTRPCQPGREKWAQSNNSPIPPCRAWPADHSTQSYKPLSRKE